MKGIEKNILSIPWKNLTSEDLEYLYFELDYTQSMLAIAFNVTKKQVSYKLKKYGLNKQKKWMKESMGESIKQVGNELLEKIVFSQYDMSNDSDDTLIFGPVIVKKGKHAGRIGFLDDIEGKTGFVLWGDGPALDSETNIPSAFLSNQITTYDLIIRERELSQSIFNARMLRLEGKGSPHIDNQLVELYGEYTFITGLLSDAYATANYLQGEENKTVFISHASQDAEISLMIATDLKRAKYNVWFDKWDINLGHSIPQAITNGLDSADVLIIVLSKDYLNSAFCTDEWQSFYMSFNSQRKPIIPIIIDDSKPPTILASRKYFRIRKSNDYNTMREDYDNMVIELKLALHNNQ